MCSKAGQQNLPGRESFSRCAKAVLCLGPGPHEGHDTSVGLRLELVPEADPCSLEVGRELPVRLLFDGKPLAGVLLEAHQEQRGHALSSARTDAEGRARILLTESGRWLVAGVHMLPAEPGAGADWESLWASLTFAVAPPKPSLAGAPDA